MTDYAASIAAPPSACAACVSVAMKKSPLMAS